MFRKSILALTVLGFAASASAAFAADETHATVHRHHKAAVHQVEAQPVVEYRPWSLPQGWPHTP